MVLISFFFCRGLADTLCCEDVTDQLSGLKNFELFLILPSAGVREGHEFVSSPVMRQCPGARGKMEPQFGRNQKPDSGWTKINFDFLYVQSTGQCRGGCLGRTNYGEVVFSDY
jgi:hypothetical protein